MEIKYRNTTDDYQAWVAVVQPNVRKQRMDVHYQELFWQLVPVALGLYLAVEHEEGFVACLLITLALYHLWTKRLFRKTWRDLMEQNAREMTSHYYSLQVDETGLVQTYSELLVKIPWSLVNSVTSDGERIIIRYLNEHGVIIPQRCLAHGQREELLLLLDRRGIKKV